MRENTTAKGTIVKIPNAKNLNSWFSFSPKIELSLRKLCFMRYVASILVSLLTLALIYVLNNPIGSVPALGKLLDPSNGWGANAEKVDKDYNASFSLNGLIKPVTISFEERMVPHIQAQNDHDLFYTLGYIHAYFRLWQMDMQTRAAAGRISEIVGTKLVKDPKTGIEKNVLLEFDRSQRRKGMVYGAENSVKAIERSPQTKLIVDAYTSGVNSFIASLSFKDYPLEYKLLGFAPEPWSNLKSALLMKAMADDLTGYTEDFPLTQLRASLSKEDFELLFPLKTPGSIPVIPSGSPFNKASLAIPPTPEGAIWAAVPQVDKTSTLQPSSINSTHYYNAPYETGIGSNNWAISGTKTVSGAPILCNDPHLGLNLPSLWFEVQLQAPGMNTYGVSLPGAPGVIIGFNDSISWGLTNNYRDVKDFYEIEKANELAYILDGKSIPFDTKIEIIKINGQPDFIDKVHYTIHGPVMYDKTFEDPLHTHKDIAVTWMAHRSTNELLAVYQINKAQNYTAFTEALMHFQCPAQNIIYADRQNNIAMWGQGQFVNKWKDQGRYIMKGNTRATQWGQDIPMQENPHVLNPSQQFIASANQMTTDSTYPYWYNGYFSDFRAWSIHSFLHGLTPMNYMPDFKQGQTVQWLQESLQNQAINFKSMAAMQFNESSILEKNIAHVLKSYGVPNDYFPDSLNWNSSVASKFQILWSLIYKNIWEDDFATIPQELFPKEERTMQLILSDSTLPFYDDKRTTQKEGFKDIVQISLKATQDSIELLKSKYGTDEWYKVKGTQLTHLAKIPAFNYTDLKIGGWGNTINAVKKSHGPSWRMIVEMGKDKISAYGVYPGGQSGNPGSPYYGTFVDKWTEGSYFDLLFLTTTDSHQKGIKYTWTITRS